jgi:hypothetical protein
MINTKHKAHTAYIKHISKLFFNNVENVKSRAIVMWVMTIYSSAGGYCCRRTCCPNLQQGGEQQRHQILLNICNPLANYVTS